MGDLGLDRRPEDLCLYVFLRRELSPEIVYPKEFEGLPVVMRVVGEIPDEEKIYSDEDREEQ